MKIKMTLLRVDNIINRPLVRFMHNRPLIAGLYYKTILRLRVALFLGLNGMKSIAVQKTSLQGRLDYCSHQMNKAAEVRKYKSDIIACYVLYGIEPLEYFLYHFEDNRSHDYRRQFLSDRERKFGCRKVLSLEVFDELKKKDKFYNLAAPFFKRDVCCIRTQEDREKFKEFVKKQPRFFAKPSGGTFGANTGIYNISDWESADAAFDDFISKKCWIFEEILVQDPRMAVWNDTCVNTVRIPSIIGVNGEHVILQPFLRTGRKGAIVDNAGAGGVFAVFDPETGIVTTNGTNESCKIYERHPDSDIVYKGWQIPCYEELKKMVEFVHKSLPTRHKYVGFDFALSTKGWVLIEGNWGQFIGQIAEQKGVRYAFEKLMGLESDSCFE